MKEALLRLLFPGYHSRKSGIFCGVEGIINCAGEGAVLLSEIQDEYSFREVIRCCDRCSCFLAFIWVIEVDASHHLMLWSREVVA